MKEQHDFFDIIANLDSEEARAAAEVEPTAAKGLPLPSL